MTENTYNEKKERAAELPSAASVFAKKPPTIDPLPPAPSYYTELEAAAHLGIRLEAVQAFRRASLVAGVDFVRLPDGIQISSIGMDTLQVAITGSEKKSALIVESAQCPNPKLVLAKAPGSKQLLRVRVASNENWVRGMVMPDCIMTENPSVWVCLAKPRSRGKI